MYFNICQGNCPPLFTLNFARIFLDILTCYLAQPSEPQRGYNPYKMKRKEIMHTYVLVQRLNEAIHVKYFKSAQHIELISVNGTYYFRQFIVNIYTSIVKIRKHHVVKSRVIKLAIYPFKHNIDLHFIVSHSLQITSTYIYYLILTISM